MELAAVVVIPSSEELTAIDAVQCHTAIAHEAQKVYSSRTPILGNDVLRSWMDSVRTVGVHNLWLTSLPRERNMASDLTRFLRQGVERLLMIALHSYAEIDLADFLHFHRDSRNLVTEAQDANGHLGISLIDRKVLKAAGYKYESTRDSIQRERPYQFSGYAKRIALAKERQELVGDALIGACAMRPSGTQIREQVWIGEGAKLADSVRVTGPTYIGARTVVRAGATIGPFASVERDCVVDCGTTVEQSTVLPNTYLAPGLLIRGASVDGERLEELGSGVVADLGSARLSSRIQRQERAKRSEGIFSPLGPTSPWGFAPSPVASQSWFQVRL